MPNQKEGMLPAARAAFYANKSDTRFKDLMPPAWDNNESFTRYRICSF